MIPVNETEYMKNHKTDDKKYFEEEKDEIIGNIHKIANSSKRNSMLKRIMTAKKDEWEYASKIVVYDRKSLYLFHHENKFRRIIVAIVESKTFENVILFLIVVNSLCYTFQDYSKNKYIPAEIYSKNWWLE